MGTVDIAKARKLIDYYRLRMWAAVLGLCLYALIVSHWLHASWHLGLLWIYVLIPATSRCLATAVVLRRKLPFSRLDKGLAAQVHVLSNKAGLKRDPFFWLAGSGLMSSIGLFRNNALILVGPEIRTLQTEEIVACAAHEIAHIKHRDAIIRTITFTVFMFLIAYITRVTMQDLLFQVELFCFSLLIGFTLVIASMRAQEFAADATSALLTEHLENLISVLNDREMPASQPSTWATLTSTHPSRKHRIAALQSLILEP